MVITHRSRERPGTYSTENLSSVTSATDGDAIHTQDFEKNTVYVEVSGNTGSVTVTIQASYDGSTWFDLDSTVYTTNKNDVFSYADHFAYMRTRTTSHTNATVKTNVQGLS